MAINGTIVAFETIRTIGFADITSGFKLIGTYFQNPVRILILSNGTDKDMYLSDDGINIKMAMAAGQERFYSFGNNASNNVQTLELAANTGIWIKYVEQPTEGSFFVETMYAKA